MIINLIGWVKWKFELFEYVCYLNNWVMWVEMWLFGIGPNFMNKSNKEVLSVKSKLSLLVSKGLKEKHS